MKKQITTIAICLITLVTTAQTWSNVGSGLNGTVNALYTDSAANRLYATGSFSGNVAYFDGTTWNVIAGYPGTHAGLSIVSYTNNSTGTTDLLVGSDSIYVYNGTSWSTISGLGTGSNGISIATGGIYGTGYGCLSLCVYPACNSNGFQDVICAGGKFNTFGGLITLDPFNSYNATHINPNCGTGTGNKTFTDLKIFKDTLYAVGPYSAYIGKFTAGASMTSVATTTVSPLNNYVNHAEVFNNEIYFSGVFSTLQSVNSPSFIGYTGSSFASTGGGPGGVMQTYNNNLYITSNVSSGMQIWNGTSLSNITSPIGYTVNCMAVFNGELYAGGNFTTPYANIAKYNDHTSTTGINSNVNSINVSVYPNPTNGKFNVRVDGEATVEVINCLGQVVTHMNINDTQSFSVNEPGVYIVRIVQNGKLFTSRLINQ